MKAALTRAVLPRGNDLVHQLQLERGCSCAWVASGGTLLDFENLVISHRGLTTSLLSEPEHKQLREITHEPLMRLRKQSDDAVVGNGRPATDKRRSGAHIHGAPPLGAWTLGLEGEEKSSLPSHHLRPLG